jgi:glycosyltransferase involved in cell wall biosynthesis
VSSSPLVSVIIPTRDRPLLLARAVESAVRQTYERLEIVVIDDCSIRPVVLPSELADDPRVHVLRLDSWVGAGAARNAGVRASRGSLLAFLDDDDSWRSVKIARQVEALAGCDERVAAVETGFDLWNGGRLVLRYLPSTDRDLARTLLEKPCLFPSTVLLRRSAFERLGGFDPVLRRGEDWDLWVRFADEYQAVAIPEVHVDRLETPSPEMLVWYEEMVRRLEPRIAELPPDERSRIRAAHLLVEAHLLSLLGKRRAARSKALRAMRERPRRWPRPVLYVFRSVVGERVWSVGKRVQRTLLRMLRRDPLVSH